VTFFLRTIPQQHASIKTLFEAIGQQDAEDAIKIATSTPQAKRYKKSKEPAASAEEPQVSLLHYT